LKTFLLRAAKAELEAEPTGGGERVKLPIVRSREASYDLSPARRAALQEAEDLEILAGH
jgi:hypothetical protein